VLQEKLWRVEERESELEWANRDLKKKLDAAHEEIEEKDEQLERNAQEAEDLQAEIAELKREVDGLHSFHARRDEDIQGLLSQLRKCEAKLVQELQGKLRHAREENTCLKSQLRFRVADGTVMLPEQLQGGIKCHHTPELEPITPPTSGRKRTFDEADASDRFVSPCPSPSARKVKRLRRERSVSPQATVSSLMDENDADSEYESCVGVISGEESEESVEGEDSSAQENGGDESGEGEGWESDGSERATERAEYESEDEQEEFGSEESENGEWDGVRFW
jgi:hypothetical protein